MSPIRIVIVLIIIVLIGWGIWAYTMRTPVMTPEEQSSAALQPGTTNSDLDRDMTQIDTQLNASESSSNNVDASLHDQQISQ